MSTDDSSTPKTKAELLARMERARTALEEALAPLSEAELSAPGPDGWSLKDHVAHIAAWERAQLAALQGRPAYEGLGVDQATYESEDEDAINALIHAQHRDRPWGAVLAEARSVRGALLAFLAPLTEEEVHRPYRPGQTRSLLEAVGGNTFEHDEDHLPWIKERLRRRATAQP